MTPTFSGRKSQFFLLFFYFESKKCFRVPSPWGLYGPKTHWGMHLLDKIMILQMVKQTIRSLAVGYANRPKKAQNGALHKHVLYHPIHSCEPLLVETVISHLWHGFRPALGKGRD